MPELANLTPAIGVSGPHDFAVHVRRPGQERHPRPPHPRPASMTLRNAPRNGTGWKSYNLVFISGKQKYFLPRGLTLFPINRSNLPVGWQGPRRPLRGNTMPSNYPRLIRWTGCEGTACDETRPLRRRAARNQFPSDRLPAGKTEISSHERPDLTAALRL